MSMNHVLISELRLRSLAVGPLEDSASETELDTKISGRAKKGCKSLGGACQIEVEQRVLSDVILSYLTSKQ